MADIYDRARATATRMLVPRTKGGKGLEAVLTKTVTPPYVPGQPNVPEAFSFNVSMVRIGYEIKDIDGTLIQESDTRFLVSPVQLDGSDTPEIETGDSIDFGGETWTVVNCQPWNYAGLNVGFEVQGRPA